MTNNQQIETLNKELKETLEEIRNTKDNNKKKELESCATELRNNIESLAEHCEIDFEMLTRTMLHKAMANSLLYKICKSQQLKLIILQLEDIGVPDEILSSDKETFDNYLKQIKHPTPTRFAKYHEFIKLIKSTAYRSSPQKKQELAKDHQWLMNGNSLGSEIMAMFDIPTSRLIQLLDKEDSLDNLIMKYNQLKEI